MSISPNPNSYSKGQKINVSMMLKVPIDIELEIVGVPSTQSQQTEDKETVRLIEENSDARVIVSGIGLAKLQEDNQALFSQIVNQLQQENKIFSTLTQIQPEQDNTGNTGNLDQKCDSLPIANEFMPEVPSLLQNNSTSPGSEVGQKDALCDRIDTLQNENFTVLQPQTSRPNKKLTVRLSDSLNDGMTLAVNTIGAILFLGKLANYSWEEQ
ncbi:hypothetical protein NUACC21_12150 [Scytonema sp. NUACC21]